MNLEFPIIKIKPRKDFSDKLNQLKFETIINRLIISLEFLSSEDDSIFLVNALFDTGAPFSLFPISFLEQIKTQLTLPHTIWGIINTPECQLEAEITRVPIRFIDKNGVYSPPIEIAAAFVKNENVPFLIGMKGILELENLSIKIAHNKFFLNFI